MSIIEKAMEKARLGLSSADQDIAPQKREQSPPGRGNGCPERFEAPSFPIVPCPELIMARANMPFTGGEYRLLKERILSLRRQDPNKTLFMVTSPMRNEGKTLVSCNLAAALAREFDHTVLLLDADLRAPSCHKMLGIPGRPKGLADCLLHNDPISDHLIHTGIGKFSLLCAGTVTHDTAELVTSRSMQEFLQEIKHRYPDRIVIIDTLPLVPFAESQALSRMVDGILLVVRENLTARVHLENALKSLEGCPFLGVVYNETSNFGADKEIFELAHGY